MYGDMVLMIILCGYRNVGEAMAIWYLILDIEF